MNTDLYEPLNGRHLLGGRTNAQQMTLVTQPRHFWPRLFGGRQRPQAPPREKRPGARLIGAAGILLFLLGAGLLAVSFAAQYQYVLRERHQHGASLIEAGALDVGLIIFSLLALGLARAGLSSKIERAAVIGCAIGSAVMNYAAADVTSPRSVLAYCMPPVFLAFVVDRVVRTIQRHVLGMEEAGSAWAVVAIVARRALQPAGVATLYALRFFLAPPSTCSGVRRAILAATPLPAVAAPPAPELPAIVADLGPPQTRPALQRTSARRGSATTKTARFLALAAERHDLAAVPLGDVSAIATALAPEADLHPSTARRELLRHVRALQSGETS